jgi:transcriptional regulator with XRE-family HTH domain
MSQKFNQSEASELGQSIRNHRVQANMTLVELAERSGVNAAQISRFEHGQFKTSSQNLQILCGNLQIDIGVVPARSLGARLELFAEKSERNRQAAEQIVQALEALIQPAKRR